MNRQAFRTFDLHWNLSKISDISIYPISPIHLAGTLFRLLESNLELVVYMDDPRLVHQISHTQPADTSASCPFCLIAATYGPISPSSAPGSPLLDPEKLEPPSHVLFSTEDVIAFLDIMPLVRGHVLVAPRKHRIKVGDLSPNECAEVGPFHSMASTATFMLQCSPLLLWLLRENYPDWQPTDRSCAPDVGSMRHKGCDAGHTP